MPRKAEIQAEEVAAVSSPLRRSNRINVVTTAAPATVASRRNSQTENAETKSVKTRRASLSQENGQKDEKVESKPAPRGRRPSATTEELEQKPEPAKTRSRRSSAASDPPPEPEQKKQPVTRRRKSASVEPEEIPKVIRGRRGSSADKTVEEDTTKKPVRTRRGSVQEEEIKEEPAKRPLRGRRNSTDKAEKPEVEVKENKTRGRRASTEKLEEEPEGKVAKLTPAKTRRRLSTSENATNLEPIIEQDSEAKGRSSISPEINRAVLILTPIQMSRQTEVKANLDLSVIDEDPPNETKPEEKVTTPRKSPRLNKDKNYPLRKSPRLTKDMNGAHKTSPNEEGTVEEEISKPSTSPEEAEDDVFEETVGKEEAKEKEASPRKKRLSFEPEQTEEGNSQKEKETSSKEAHNISMGSDGSFRFHLNVSLPSTNSQNDAEEVEDLNSSKNSNSSDKENQAVISPQVQDTKRAVLEDKQAVMQNLIDINSKDKFKEVNLEEKVVLARVSNVFRPRMRENSFLEPMEVDEFPATPQKATAGSKVDKTSPVVSTPIESRNLKQLVTDETVSKSVDDTVDESFKLCLSASHIEDAIDKSAVAETASFTDESELKTSIDQKEYQNNILEDASTKENVKNPQGTEESTEVKELKHTQSPEETVEKKEDEIEVKEVQQIDSCPEQLELKIEEKELLESKVEDDQIKDSPKKSEELQSEVVASEPEKEELSESEKDELRRSRSPQFHHWNVNFQLKEKNAFAKSKSPQPQQIQVDEAKEERKSRSPQPKELNTSKLAPKKELLRRSKSPQQMAERDELSKTPDKNHLEEKQEARESKSVSPQKPVNDELAPKEEEITANKSTSLASKSPASEEKEETNAEIMPGEEETEKCIDNLEEPNSAPSPIKEKGKEELESNSLSPQKPISDELALKKEEITVNNSTSPLSESPVFEEKKITSPEVMETEEQIPDNSEAHDPGVASAPSPAKEKDETEQENPEAPALEDSEKQDASDSYSFELPSDDELESPDNIEEKEDNICDTGNNVAEGAQPGPLKRKSIDSEDPQSKKIKLTPEKSVQNMAKVDECNGTPDLEKIEAMDNSAVEAEEETVDASAKEGVDNEELATVSQDEEIDALKEGENSVQTNVVNEEAVEEPVKVVEKLDDTILDTKEPAEDYSQMEGDFKDEVQSYRVVQEEESGNLKISVLETSGSTRRHSVHADEDSEEENVLVLDSTLENSQSMEEHQGDDISRRDSPRVQRSCKKPVKKNRVVEEALVDEKEQSNAELCEKSSEEKAKTKKQKQQLIIEAEDAESDEEKTKRKKQKQSKRKKEDVESKDSEKETGDNFSKEVMEETSFREEELDEQSDAELNEEKRATNEDIGQEDPKKKKKKLQLTIEVEESDEEGRRRRKKQKESKHKKEDVESHDSEKGTDVVVKKRSSRLEGLEEFATSKLDEFLSKKLSDRDDTDDSYECTSDEEDDGERNEFISSMAEEGEEDTPSEGSNDIIEVGESIHSTDSEVESDDDYDEDDSFICDEEHAELLSGEEYDLGDDKKSKPKKSRIIKLDSFEEDVIKIEKKEKPVEKKKKSRIIRVPDSSESDEEKIKVEEDKPTEEELARTEPEQVTVEEEDTSESSDDMEAAQNQSPRKKKSSITIHENISVSDIQDTALSERITHLVDTFCTTIRKGEISLNLSLEHAVKYSSEPTTQDGGVTKSIKTPRKSIQKSTSDGSSEVHDEEFVKEVKKAKKGKSWRESRGTAIEKVEQQSDELAEVLKKYEMSTADSNDTDDDVVFVEEETKKKKRRRRKKPAKKQTLSGDSEETEENSPEKMAERLSVTLDNIDDLGETKKRATKKRRLSKSLDDLGSIEIKSKKKRTSNIDVSKKKKKTKKPTSSEDDLRTQTFSIMNQLITDVKNRPVRAIKPSTALTDMNSSWTIEVANERPSTSLVTNRERLEYRAGKVHPKDFKNQMLYNSSRVKRVHTKTLLKKRGVNF